MKLKKAKFFQVVEIPSEREHNADLGTSIDDKEHDIEIVGYLVKITHRKTGKTVYATLFNVSYLKVADEQATDPSPKASPKGDSKTKQKQD